MKLNQEQIKKMAASLCVLLLLVYAYFAFLLGPLQKSERGAASGIDATRPAIADAKTQITKTAELEKQAPEATAYLKNLTNSIPDGAPIAWFPPKMTDFFRSHGIDKVTTHLISEGASDMPGFKKLVWAVDMPRVEFIPLGKAISSLENDEPLLNILNVSVEATREDAQFQHATLTVATMVKS